MVTVQQSSMQGKIEAGIELAKKQAKSVLISHVKQAEGVDPLSFLHAGRKFFLGNRFYWKDSDSQVTYVGLGSSFSIPVSNSKNRYKEIEKQWQSLLNDGFVDTPNSNVFGTGPLLFGGISFDPQKMNTPLWDSFKEGKFILPTILLTITDENTYITTNIVCKEQDDIDSISDFIQTMERELILSNQLFTPDQACSIEKIEEVDPKRWQDSIEDAKSIIYKGDIEKVVLARELIVKTSKEIEVASLLYRLETQQPGSFIFAFESDDCCFVGASPERLVKKSNGRFMTTCLAGSIGRGATIEEDDKLGEELLRDQKNIIEHEVVVDMIKNAMVEACKSIDVADTPGLYKARDIQHLYTPIIGIAKEDVSLLDMVQNLHPTPALGGNPRDKALEIIREVELLDRGLYAAPIGWFDSAGNGEFAVSIRSGLICGDKASLFAGCGIVKDSDPVSEYKETNIKFKPMLSALGGKPVE